KPLEFKQLQGLVLFLENNPFKHAIKILMDSMDLRDTVNLMDRGGSGNLRDKESLMSAPLRPICPLKFFKEL
ncbi:hypothetical protein, partial [Akkermansia sp.]|uniref:hypothetical protein n=1 Tax=Akkermansia sp. TaxID=1872421 RepID=UPI003AB74235